MKTIFGYLKQYIKTEFEWKSNLAVFLFACIGLAVNYKINLENGIIDSYYGSWLRMLWYFLLYGSAWFGSFFIVRLVKKDWELVKNKQFWILSMGSLLILSFDVTFHYTSDIITEWVPVDLWSYAFRVLNNAIGLLTTFVPSIIFLLLIGRMKEFWQWSNPAWRNIKPYFVLLLFMLPLITWASFQDSFTSYYPVYKDSGQAEFLQIPEWVTVAIFESLYALDFFSVEFIFRGLMVAAFAAVIGKESILPMVTTYCFLHFGKPFGEAFSSFFGGYVLGIIAFYSRNIIGGTMVHVGIALLMELGAYLQNTFGK